MVIGKYTLNWCLIFLYNFWSELKLFAVKWYKTWKLALFIFNFILTKAQLLRLSSPRQN